MSTWRDKFRPQIAATINRLGDDDMPRLRAALRALWDELDMGPRQYHPYKIFCDEIKAQLGTKKIKEDRRPRAVKPALAILEREGQCVLFDADEGAG